MTRCSCIKKDSHSESPCESAEFNPFVASAECTHACVIALQAQFDEEHRARTAAERKLEQYRRAVQPFVKNCREVVALADKEEGGAK